MRRGPLCDKQPHAAADPGTATSTVADESPQATTSTVSFESLQLCGRIDVFSADQGVRLWTIADKLRAF